MFGFGSSSSTPAPETSPPSAPNREERAACWKSRDAYFDCLTKNNVLIAGSETDAGLCLREKKDYEGSCSKSWLEYFNKRRILEMRQKATIEATEASRNNNVANKGR